MFKFFLGIFLALIFAQATASGAQPDPCGLPLPDPRWELRLVDTQRPDETRFMGNFYLKNIGNESPLKIQGRWWQGHFHIDPSHVRMQFMDLRGVWVDIIHTWGHSIDELVVLPIRTNSSLRFNLELLPKALADHSASAFRILVVPEQSEHCVVSEEFEATPAKPSTTGYASIKKSARFSTKPIH